MTDYIFDKFKNNTFFNFVIGFLIGCYFIIFIANLDFSDIYDKIRGNSSKYIKISDIHKYLKKEDKIVLDKNSYILKSDFDIYLKEYLINKKLELISQEQKNTLKNSIAKFQHQSMLQQSPQKKEKTITYLSELNDIQIYFLENSTVIDPESLKEINNLLDLNLSESIIMTLIPCRNKFETYDIDISQRRILNLKNLLKTKIKPRKILIKENNFKEPECSDPRAQSIKNEKEEELVLGINLEFRNSTLKGLHY